MLCSVLLMQIRITPPLLPCAQRPLPPAPLSPPASTSHNAIIAILDAIIMASIIISRLISIIGISLLVLVLLVVLMGVPGMKRDC